MLKRIISGAIIAVAAVILITVGGYPLLLASLVISLIGVFELYRVMKIQWEIPGIIGYLVVVLYYFLLLFDRMNLLMFLVILALLLMMSFYVFTFPRYDMDQITAAFFGIFYVGILLSYVYQVRELLQAGRYFVWFILIGSFGSDTCAYFVGMAFGKHKLAPVLSPKKSIEGAIGGVVGSALLGAAFGFVFKSVIGNVFSPMIASAAVCAICSVISQIGDLAASAMKRNHGIKDYGDLIPGHGGILDRFDSVLFTAPSIYFAVYFLSRL